MSRVLSFRNRQRICRVDTAQLRQIALSVLNDQLRVESFELGLHLVDSEEMTRINETFLQHDGSTDVITFDHSEPGTIDAKSPIEQTHSKRQLRLRSVTLHGEIFICLGEARRQAREFRTTWQSELVRYVIHGLLHLCGFDDLKPSARRIMKREENRLLRATAQIFNLSRLGAKKNGRRTATLSR